MNLKIKIIEKFESSKGYHRNMLDLINEEKKNLDSILNIFKHTDQNQIVGKNLNEYKKWKRKFQLNEMMKKFELNSKKINSQDGYITNILIQIIKKLSQFNAKNPCPLLNTKFTERALSIYRELVYQQDFNKNRDTVKIEYIKYDSVISLKNELLKLYSDSLNHIEDEIRIMEEKKKEIEEELDLTETTLKVSQDDLEDTRSQLENLQDDLKDTRSQLEDSNDDLKDTRSQLEDSQDDLKDVKDTLEAKKDSLVLTKNDLEEAKENLGKAEGNLGKAEEKLKKAEEKLGKAEFNIYIFQIIFSIFFIMSIILWHSQRRLRRIKTGLEETKNKLKGQSKQLQALLRENSHRSKNQLNEVSNILYLQERNSMDLRIKEVLEKARNRIGVFGVIHSQLYDAGKKFLGTIKLKEYIEELIQNLVKHSSYEKSLQYFVETFDTELNPGLATKVGIMVNELVQNALSHAFDNVPNPKISVIIKKSDNEFLELSVNDNGKGLDFDLNQNPHQGLGLRLIQIIVGNNPIKYTYNNGACFKLTMPIDLHLST